MPFLSKGIKKDILFILDIASNIYHKPYCGFATAGFNSQGMGAHAKMSNVTKHMPSQSQL